MKNIQIMQKNFFDSVEIPKIVASIIESYYA